MVKIAGVRGTIDFALDTTNDIVIERPRWVLDSPVEVMRWYQLQSGYFSARFHDRKDVIVVDNGLFDVTPQVAALWGQYRARLLELYVRFFVRVGGSARVRLAMNTSAVRYSTSSIERPTLEQAVAYVLHAREEAEKDKAASEAQSRLSRTMPQSSKVPNASET